MSKSLEVLGIVLVVIMALSFMGVLQPTIEPGLSTVFWICAGGTLMIIIFRKRKQKQQDKVS